MERRDETTSSGMYGGDGGAGGKMRKPSTRKPPATPYARPPASNLTGQHRGGGGWLSKYVDPAYRLISAGASRILPSLFSKSATVNALPSTNGKDHEAVEDASGDDQKDYSRLEISRSSGLASPSGVGNELRCKVNFDEQREKVSPSDDYGLSEIEQMLKEKRFSRDEINRLSEILHSKANVLYDVDLGKQSPNINVEGDRMGALAAHKTPRTLTKEKPEASNRDMWKTSTPVPPSTIRDEVGASPIDIAKAYMGSRISEMGLSSRSLVIKDERAISTADEFASKPVIPLPSPKSSICWPGAMVQDQRGFMTPQIQSGKFGLQNFPRTPYSRTIYSKSRSKLTDLHGDSNRFRNTSSTSLQQSKTSIYGEVRSWGNEFDNGSGSVGPIRRVRLKVGAESPSSGSVSLRSSLNNHSQVGFSPFKNFEPGATSGTPEFRSVEMKPNSYEVGIPTVHPQSSLIARKILDDIDGKRPTLAEKSAELKRATVWKNPSSSEAAQNAMERFGGQKYSAPVIENGANSLLKAQSQQRSGPVAGDEVVQNTFSSNLKFGNAGDNAGSSFDLSQSSNSLNKSMQEKAFMGFANSERKEKNELRPLYNQSNGKDASKTAPNASSSDVLNLQRPRSNFSGHKPVLASISTNKHGPGTNSSGFTFPVSASSGELSEPPTPSIMPSAASSAGGLNQPKEGAEGVAIPTYTFGSKRSSPALVFSFPSSSTVSNQIEASDLKFTFGSDKKSRVSFSSVGKDAICY